MQIIYNIDGNRVFTGETREIEDNEGAGPDWCFTAPPELQKGQFAAFIFPEWIILDEYPNSPVMIPVALSIERTKNPTPDKPMVI